MIYARYPRVYILYDVLKVCPWLLPQILYIEFTPEARCCEWQMNDTLLDYCEVSVGFITQIRISLHKLKVGTTWFSC